MTSGIVIAVKRSDMCAIIENTPVGIVSGCWLSIGLQCFMQTYLLNGVVHGTSEIVTTPLYTPENKILYLQSDLEYTNSKNIMKYAI